MKGFSEERIEAALQECRDFLSGKRRNALVTVHHQPSYRQQTDPEKMVEQACACIRADAASDEPHIVPAFWADFGTISTARLWGGKELVARDGGGVHIEPVIRTLDEMERVIPQAKPFEASDFKKAETLWRQVCERLGSDRIFLRTPDFQGPMNTLALIMDQTELMCGLYEEPEKMAWALDRVTDVLIDRFMRLRTAVGKEQTISNIWPFVILPDGNGVSLSQDYMPLISPEIYERFEIPCLKRISDAFGGVWIHCCGQFEQHLDVLARADLNLLGLEIHCPYTSLDKVYAVFGDRIAYMPYVAQKELSAFDGLEAFAESLADKPCGRARYWFATCHEWNDVPRLKRAAAKLG